jgi:uncharacterized membrane protein
MEYPIKDFLFGPHLIGVLFIIIGLLQRYLPPKSINRWYGYRTLTARSSQQAWDEGNHYSAVYMMRAGLFLLVLGAIINAMSILYITDFQTRQWIGYLILFGGAMGVGILSTMATERHLHKTFPKLKVKKPPVKRR